MNINQLLHDYLVVRVETGEVDAQTPDLKKAVNIKRSLVENTGMKYKIVRLSQELAEGSDLRTWR
ncbi:MAG: hypothetical protein R3321_01150 [Nitrososphaeraceae archaeon]|nr:hypothetical protein [Nitrososphaeraceae archaeon]